MLELRPLFRAVAIFTAIAWGAGCGPIEPADDSVDEEALNASTLRYSESADRSHARALDGAALQGKVYVALASGGSSVSEVDFSLDGTARNVEKVVPFDFIGGAADGSALPFDTSALTAGSHTLLAKVVSKNGHSRKVTATFKVGHPGTTPPPPAADAGTPPQHPDAGTTTTPPPPPVTTTGFPDATNTGVPAGVTLTPSGSITITTANAVVEGLDITGTVTVAAANVTIRNCRIHGTSYYAVYIQSGNLIIEDSELLGSSEALIGFDNWVGRRLNMHDFAADGCKGGDNVTLEDSYIHDSAPSPGAHADGLQVQSGVHNVVIRHNNIDPKHDNVGANSALFIAPDLGPSTNGPLTIDGNLLGGGNYSMYVVDGNNGQYFISNISITNNRFKRDGQYGAFDVNVPVTASGNVYDDTGAPISL